MNRNSEMDVHDDYNEKYVASVPRTQIHIALSEGMAKVDSVFNQIDEQRSMYRYATGKWSIREVLGHILDTERVFSFRAMSIARGESQKLPGFDENHYAQVSNAHSRGLEDLLGEFRSLRRANIYLFASFGEDELNRIGHMSGAEASVRSIGRIMVGHCTHHLTVIEKLYLA